MGSLLSVGGDPDPQSPEDPSKPVNSKGRKQQTQGKDPPSGSEPADNRSSMDKLNIDELPAGNFSDGNTKKHWLDKNSKHCFMLFPKALEITWGGDDRYWKWRPLDEGSSGNKIEVIELLNVCWLEISGKINTSELSPGTSYKAAFILQIVKDSYGWEVPVNIKLRNPHGKDKFRKEDLKARPRENWVEIPIGDFMVEDDNKYYEIEFSMYKYGGCWKKGMILKGIIIYAEEKA